MDAPNEGHHMANKSPASFSFAVSSDQGLEDGEDQGSHDKTNVSGALGHNPSASDKAWQQKVIFLHIFVWGVYEVAINIQYNQLNFNTFFPKTPAQREGIQFFGSWWSVHTGEIVHWLLILLIFFAN